jgi:plasmid stability protein
MNLTIELSEESAARLRQQAAAHGLSLEAWVQALAQEKARTEESEANRSRSQAAASRILEIQQRVRPDPEGWTIHDYIDRGRS